MLAALLALFVCALPAVAAPPRLGALPSPHAARQIHVSPIAPRPNPATGRLLVRFKPGANLAGAVASASGRLGAVVRGTGWRVVAVPDAQRAKHQLAQAPGVDAISFDYERHASAT